MYSNKSLRLLLVVFLIIGLLPIVIVGLKAGEAGYDAMLFSIWLRALLVGSVFAVIATMILLKISGASLEPAWLTIVGIFALYVFCTTIAGFVPAVGLLVLVILGGGFSAWLLELSVRMGVYVGIVFFAAKFLGGLSAFTVSVSPVF